MITRPRDLILASASPRRKQLLELCGLSFRVVSPEIDESALPGEAPEAIVTRLAADKAAAIHRHYPESCVIGADTLVVLDGCMLGKPQDQAEAREMLQRLQGREHAVWGGFAVMPGAAAPRVEAHVTTVQFAPLDARQIAAYIATGEPLDKAGAYAIQGYAAQFATSISGSYTNVVGLNVAALMRVLRETGW